MDRTQGWDSRAVTWVAAMPPRPTAPHPTVDRSPGSFPPGSSGFTEQRVSACLTPDRHLLAVSAHGGPPPPVPIRPSTCRRPSTYTHTHSVPGWGTPTRLTGSFISRITGFITSGPLQQLHLELPRGDAGLVCLPFTLLSRGRGKSYGHKVNTWVDPFIPYL